MLVDDFLRQSEGVDAQFEPHTFTSDWTMPYRLFRPKASGPQPLVIYLHGSGGSGTDNQKQMGLGNVFGTRVAALAANQARVPCYVLAPQSDRGWIRYEAPPGGSGAAIPAPGLGDGVRVALELVDALLRQFPIDKRRLYVMGQSMGGAGVWNMTAHRPRFFAAAVACCGSISTDDPAASAATPLWNFHGDADTTVPVSISRERIKGLRTAGAHPLATEYAGVNHNAWEWAFTEPALLSWLFAQRSS